MSTLLALRCWRLRGVFAKSVTGYDNARLVEKTQMEFSLPARYPKNETSTNLLDHREWMRSHAIYFRAFETLPKADYLLLWSKDPDL
jgi:hypothetical protein